MMQLQEHLLERVCELESSAGLTAMIPKRTVRVCIVTGMDPYAFTLFESVFYSVGVICTLRNALSMFKRGLLMVENFLPKIDGVTRTLARLLDHLRETGHEALVVGPDNGLVHPNLFFPFFPISLPDDLFHRISIRARIPSAVARPFLLAFAYHRRPTQDSLCVEHQASRSSSTPN
jgi:hypothetical protein